VVGYAFTGVLTDSEDAGFTFAGGLESTEFVGAGVTCTVDVDVACGDGVGVGVGVGVDKTSTLSPGNRPISGRDFELVA
jgi:hypothetical protein